MEELTEAEWFASQDAEKLLAFAVPRIPRQLTCLALTEIVERLWPAWHRRHPHDWRPALALATLRAWCFGEASVGDVRFARDEAERAGHQSRARPPGTSDAFPFSPYVLIRGISAASSYASERTSGEVASHAAVDLVRWCASAENERREEAKTASEASSFAWDSPSPATRAYAFAADAIAETITRDGEREVLAAYSDLVRRLVPFPFFESRYWEPRDARVLVETTVLKRDGWRCEAVLRPTPQADRTGTWH